MPTKLRDYFCPKCDYTFEYLQHGQSLDLPPDCPCCEYSFTVPLPIGGKITKCHDRSVLQDTLKKRSADHTLRELKKLAGHKGSLPPNLGRPGGPTIG